MKNSSISIALSAAIAAGCAGSPTQQRGAGDRASTTPSGVASEVELPREIRVVGIAQNPEGIEYDSSDTTFLLSSLNAGPIIKVHPDGRHVAFTSGEPFPLSSAGLQVDRERNRLLVAGFNGAELLDDNPETRGVSYLRVYDLTSGEFQQDIHLSPLMPDAQAYFANDVAVDAEGNAYVSDWYAGVVYRVDLAGTPSVFWTNGSVVPGGPNGLDFHPDGYLLVSVLNDPSYSAHALVKVPVDDPSAALDVAIADPAFSGFDGMVVTATGRVVGVTNDGASAGGNVLLELDGGEDWTSATVARAIEISASTTVAMTPGPAYFVIHQDFSDAMATTWTVEQIAFD